MGDNKDIKLHVAGATVKHESPFSTLPSHANTKELTVEFIKKWAVPYYLNIGKSDQHWVDNIKDIKPEITHEVCYLLLGDFNWRTRLVGAYFAAVKDYKDLTNIIGIHLLKSEVCCVGHIYGLVLAFFNTTESIQYLHDYLDYYLQHPELYFDQLAIVNVIRYLDRMNCTTSFAQHLGIWETFMDSRKQQGRGNTVGIEEFVKKNQLPQSNSELQPTGEKNSPYEIFYSEQYKVLQRLAEV